jgi:sugar/nucleoside kinase (ribokinase family)
MTRTRTERLLVVGSAIVDLVLYVDAVPDPGGDVLARRSLTRVGGAFNVLAAAVAAGLPTAYVGLTGDGPFGTQVRAALTEAGVELVFPEPAATDSGFCVALVDRAGERTFATTVGAEGGLTTELLATVVPRETDAIYVSGYDLAYPHGQAIAEWVRGLGGGRTVLLDPGPLVAEIDADLLDRVLECVSWLSLNLREGVLLTSHAEPKAIARTVFERAPALEGVVIRDGANGCDVFWAPEEGQHVPAPEVQVVDSNGAGDVHVAAFLAALTAGHGPVGAARAANDTAARAVTTFGPGGA